MDLEAVPIIKFDIEGIRHQIKMHLGASGSELGVMIDKSIEHAIANYDFDGKVTMIVHEVITKEIDAFFKYGPGCEAAKAIVTKTLNDAFNPYAQNEPSPPKEE